MPSVWNPLTSQVSRVTCPKLSGPLLHAYHLQHPIIRGPLKIIKYHKAPHHSNRKGVLRRPLLEIEDHLYTAIPLLQTPSHVHQHPFPLCLHLSGSTMQKAWLFITPAAITIGVKETILFYLRLVSNLSCE